MYLQKVTVTVNGVTPFLSLWVLLYGPGYEYMQCEFRRPAM